SSTSPSSRSMRSNSSGIDAVSSTSCAYAYARVVPTLSLIAAQSASSSPARRASSATGRASCASSRASAAPMPEEAPTTMMVPESGELMALSYRLRAPAASEELAGARRKSQVAQPDRVGRAAPLAGGVARALVVVQLADDAAERHVGEAVRRAGHRTDAAVDAAAHVDVELHVVARRADRPVDLADDLRVALIARQRVRRQRLERLALAEPDDLGRVRLLEHADLLDLRPDQHDPLVRVAVQRVLVQHGAHQRVGLEQDVRQARA